MRVDAHYCYMVSYYELFVGLQRILRYFGRTIWFCATFFGVGAAAFADTVSVFAPSSLQGALNDIAQNYEVETGDEVTLVFAGSSAIARQVALGAPADVVVLADTVWADWLIEQGALNVAMPIISNRLIVIGLDTTPFESAAQIEAALGDGVLAMAQTDTVPAGRYGRAALTSLGLWDVLSPRIVQAANVRATLRFVERGEAPLGIGYASDLVALPNLVEVYSFAPDSYPQIIYSGGYVTDQGVDFMAYLQSKMAQDILAVWGFTQLDVAQ